VCISRVFARKSMYAGLPKSFKYHVVSLILSAQALVSLKLTVLTWTPSESLKQDLVNHRQDQSESGM